jgi:hypothetical protein
MMFVFILPVIFSILCAVNVLDQICHFRHIATVTSVCRVKCVWHWVARMCQPVDSLMTPVTQQVVEAIATSAQKSATNSM